MAFVEHIREYQKRTGKTNAEIGRIIGKSDTSISQWVHNKCLPVGNLEDMRRKLLEAEVHAQPIQPGAPTGGTLEITPRAQIAAMAMQGLLAGRNLNASPQEAGLRPGYRRRKITPSSPSRTPTRLSPSSVMTYPAFP